LDNTLEVYEKVNLELRLGEPIFPRAKLPDAETAESYLVKKARQGLERRLAELERQGKLFASKEEYWKRLEMELEVIIEKGYASYFLIVSDFIEWARSKGIPVGPGRGSAAGALTSYALYITNLDPIRWGLLFERFLNKERPSLPDIDVDFCMERRDEVIEYVAKTYGQEYIAKIATFGSLSARQAIRDVGRVLGFKPKEIDPIAKMITLGPQTTLQEEVKRPEIQRLMESSPRIRELFEIALKLEGLPRHPSIHAAGVVISGVPVVEVAPVMKIDEDEVVVQYDMKACEAVGLIKFDFLGLKTLTIIINTLKLIKEAEGLEIDLNSIPLDDPKVFELLSSGETDGVFQLESEGMKDLLRRLKPTDFNDLIAVLALYRPGPLGGGLVDRYIETKHGRRASEYIHPLLEPILKETYGVIVYQEQVMEIARALAGYTLGEADLLRRAIGKKEKELMQNLKSDFIERAKSRGIAEEIAEKVFDLIEKFADYGFNKSHAAAYALLSYQTAYLKAHYLLYFLASILTYEVGKSEEVSKYLSVAERMGIKVLPPDVNKSAAGFIVEGQALRLGLQAIKNVGEEAVKEIISKRPYRSFMEFCQKVDSQKVNQRVISALIKAGAFDSLEPNRAKLLANLPKILSFSQQMKMSTLFGQASLLSVSSNLVLEDVPPWTEDELLQFEKEALGFYLTSHPLKKWRPFVELFSKTNLSQQDTFEDGESLILACLISDIAYKKTRTGEQMAILRLEDEFSNAKALLFPDVLNRALEFLQEGRLIWVRAKIDKDEESMSLVVEDIAPMEDLRMFTEGRFELEIEAKDVEPSMLTELKEFLSERKEPALPIKLILKYPDWYVHFEPNGLSLPLDKTKITMMKKLFPAIVLKYQP
jgi:DNA polymerase-3 subunit alpha